MGDRVRQKGENQVWAGGKVTIDRSDLAARGDSLWLRTGKDGKGSMIGGQPTLRGFGKDTFDLTGKRIDFTLDEKDLTGIMALDSAHAVTGDVDLTGDTVSIALKEKKAELTRAWGRTQRPVGLAGDYELRGDSLAIDTPKGVLKRGARLLQCVGRHQARFGNGRARLGGGRHRDHPLRGDRLGGHEDHARCGSSRRMDSARSFYRAVEQGTSRRTARRRSRRRSTMPGRTASWCSMATTGDGGMERVDLYGHVDGIQLEPGTSQGRWRCKPPAAPDGHRRSLRRRPPVASPPLARRSSPEDETPLHWSRVRHAGRGHRPQQELPRPAGGG